MDLYRNKTSGHALVVFDINPCNFANLQTAIASLPIVMVRSLHARMTLGPNMHAHAHASEKEHGVWFPSKGT